ANEPSGTAGISTDSTSFAANWNMTVDVEAKTAVADVGHVIVPICTAVPPESTFLIGKTELPADAVFARPLDPLKLGRKYTGLTIGRYTNDDPPGIVCANPMIVQPISYGCDNPIMPIVRMPAPKGRLPPAAFPIAPPNGFNVITSIRYLPELVARSAGSVHVPYVTSVTPSW